MKNETHSRAATEHKLKILQMISNHWSRMGEPIGTFDPKSVFIIVSLICVKSLIFFILIL